MGSRTWTDDVSTGTRADPPEVMVLATCASVGGTERAVRTLTSGLDAHGLAVRTVFPVSSSTEATLAWFRRGGVEAEASPAVLDLAAPHGLRDVLRLVRFLRRADPDVVNIHFGGEHASLKDLLAIRASGRRRCVVTIHHAVPIASGRKRLLTRAATMLAHDVVVHTPAMRGLLEGYGCPTDRIHVVPLGLPVPEDLPTRAAARARLGLPDDAFVVGSLARLVPHKGIGDLVAAVARVAPAHPGLRLVVGGDGPLREELAAQADAALGASATFLGRLEETLDLYAACDVFALPSHQEGFGLVYVEAAFHGVPSVAADVGGVRSAVVDGETGVLVPAGDVAALAAAIARLVDDPAGRAGLGRAARQRALSTFTSEHMVRGYLELLADGRGPRVDALARPSSRRSGQVSL